VDGCVEGVKLLGGGDARREREKTRRGQTNRGIPPRRDAVGSQRRVWRERSEVHGGAPVLLLVGGVCAPLSHLRSTLSAALCLVSVVSAGRLLHCVCVRVCVLLCFWGVVVLLVEVVLFLLHARSCCLWPPWPCAEGSCVWDVYISLYGPRFGCL
jgi:hypothetical protein